MRIQEGKSAVDWLALICALLLLPVGVYAALCPRRVRKGYTVVPERDRPPFWDMPDWFFRGLGIVTLGASVVFLFMFFHSWRR
jgi:hypothetical protein